MKGWAYPLTWLVLLISGIGVLAGLLNTGDEVPIRVMMVGFYGALFVLHVWLNRALKRGTQAAWTVQFVLSVIGLLGIPLGTLIHGYILSQWFKPETKSWFGA